MGHNTLGVIPRSVKWKRVLDLLEADGSNDAVFAASAAAAEKDMLDAADDPMFVESVRLLLAIPAAARAEDFGDALRRIDLSVRGEPELLDILIAVSGRLDEVKRGSNRRTDLGELAGRALNTTLTELVGAGLPGLLETLPEDVRLATRDLSRSNGISRASRAFFTNLTQAAISYWLERALADQAHPDGRFSAAGSRTAFDTELRAFVHEASRIIQEFSGGWYGKTLYKSGTISDRDAVSFGAVCLKKIVAELRVKRAVDA